MLKRLMCVVMLGGLVTRSGKRTSLPNLDADPAHCVARVQTAGPNRRPSDNAGPWQDLKVSLS